MLRRTRVVFPPCSLRRGFQRTADCANSTNLELYPNAGSIEPSCLSDLNCCYQVKSLMERALCGESEIDPRKRRSSVESC